MNDLKMEKGEMSEIFLYVSITNKLAHHSFNVLWHFNDTAIGILLDILIFPDLKFPDPTLGIGVMILFMTYKHQQRSNEKPVPYSRHQSTTNYLWVTSTVFQTVKEHSDCLNANIHIIAS